MKPSIVDQTSGSEAAPATTPKNIFEAQYLQHPCRGILVEDSYLLDAVKVIRACHLLRWLVLRQKGFVTS